MKKLSVNLKYKSYSIFIERGLLSIIGREMKKIYSNKKIVIITDENLEVLYLDTVNQSLSEEGYHVDAIVIPPGEKSKSIKMLTYIYDCLSDFNITRSDMIIILGGGVVGDLGGFAAATYLRGVPFVQIPTTLLAQVDSSIGGKVAIDTDKGKNLVGAFYHPKAVFIDPDALETLSTKYFNDGMGEVIKYGAIRDRGLFERLEDFRNYDNLNENIEDIIYTCCSIKKRIVENDERDTGERMILNFGHTIGHAIEKYYNYEGYSHGEAVAIGMYMITAKSEEKGITEEPCSERIKALLIKYNLPYCVDNVDKNVLKDTIKLDKKSSSGYIRLVMLKEIGDAILYKIEMKNIEDYI